MPHNKNSDKIVKRMLPWLSLVGFLGLISYVFNPNSTPSIELADLSAPLEPSSTFSYPKAILDNDPFLAGINVPKNNADSIHVAVSTAVDQPDSTTKPLASESNVQPSTDIIATLPTIVMATKVSNAVSEQVSSEQVSNDNDNNVDTVSQQQTGAASIEPQTAQTNAQKLTTNATADDRSTSQKREQTGNDAAAKSKSGEFVKQLAVFEGQQNYWQYIENNEENKTLVAQLEPLKKLLSRSNLTQVEVLYTDYVKDGRSKPENSKIIAVRGKQKDKTWIYFTHFEKDQIYYYDFDGNAPEPSMDRTPLHYTRITSAFNLHRRHPITGRVRPHYGVDFKAPYGNPVHSTGNGIVSFAGWQHGYGRLVIVKHPNGYETRYAHMSAIEVAVGDHIKRGAVVGRVGNSGISTGHHLHYEVRVEGIAQDPMTVSLPSFKPISRDYLDVWHFRAEQYQVAMQELTRTGYTVN